jgi:hypothetical protein
MFSWGPQQSRPSTPTDPFFSNVSLLLHGEGADGSSILVDSSQFAHTSSVTAGTPTITTTEKRFGAASLRINANSEGWTIPTTALTLAAGEDCTIEFQFRPTTSVGSKAILTSNWPGNATQSISIGWNGSSISARLASNTGVNTGNLTLDVWRHIALARAGAQLSIYVDGVLAATTAIASNASSISSLFIGLANAAFGWGNGAMECFIDELRITKGVARYTANFTPPSAPFPDA